MQPDLFEGEYTTEEMERREAEAAGREYGCYHLICQEQTPTAGTFAQITLPCQQKWNSSAVIMLTWVRCCHTNPRLCALLCMKEPHTREPQHSEDKLVETPKTRGGGEPGRTQNSWSILHALGNLLLQWTYSPSTLIGHPYVSCRICPLKPESILNMTCRQKQALCQPAYVPNT